MNNNNRECCSEFCKSLDIKPFIELVLSLALTQFILLITAYLQAGENIRVDLRTGLNFRRLTAI